MEDYQTPLNPGPTLPQIYKTAKNNAIDKYKKPLLIVQRKKHVMSLMDTFLTLCIVSPLIVGHWRGTWELMSFYPRAFPPWESFIFGGVLHLSFAILRDGLQNMIKFKSKTWTKSIVAYFLRRAYTYFFAAACIMNWRGGWVIFDEWLEIEALPDGRAIPGDYIPVVIGILVIACVLLVLLRSCRNILAAPFVIGLDTKSTAFDFPTRFRVTISYTTLYAVNSKAIENNNNKSIPSPRAEKLAGSQVTIEKQVLEPFSPRPFANDLRGASPAGFYPQFGVTTTSYPHIQNHRTPARPNNIQDIIQYLSENAHRQKELIREEQQFATTNRERDQYKLFGMAQGSRTPYRQNQDVQHTHFTHYSQDPFFNYKPQDPSDINLLAPSSFRFAPAILSPTVYKNRQKLIQEAINQVNETSFDRIKKPLTLLLNIYPSPLDDFTNGNRNQFQGPGLTPRYKYQFAGPRARNNVVGPGRMFVHLNVYPGVPSNFHPNFNRNFNDDEDQDGNKRKFQTRRNQQ